MAIALLLGQHVPIGQAIIATLAIGLGIGLFHAFGIVQLGLPPFIMTLASLTALRGIGLLITNGATISITKDVFTGFSRGGFLGVPNLFWMVLVVAIPAYFLLHQSRWGRYLFAIGSNAEAARLSGVNVKAIIYLAYILSSVCAAFVGVLLAMRIGIGNPTQAEGWELQAIASSVIGGTSLFGAIGSIHGPLLGSFILTTINNGANLLNLNSFWQRIITGLLIIVIGESGGARRSLFHVRQQRLDRRQDIGDDRLDAFVGRVQSVLLIELGIGGDSLEKKRIEHDAEALGQVRIDRIEATLIVGAHIGRGAHAGEQRRDVGVASTRQYRRERSLGRRRIKPAQHVVGAKFDDQRVRSRRRRPIITRQAVGRRIAGNPGIADFDVIAFGLQRFFQRLGKALPRRQAEARRQAVAERDHMQGARPHLGGEERRCDD
jgi:ribose/xylose/arabinose/galactoside ABC-type transport system permease subunit